MTEEEKRQKKNQAQKDYLQRTHYKANNEWNKKNTRRFVLQAMKNTESDIIERLDSVPNVSGYLKELVREDAKKNPDKFSKGT